VLPANSGRSSYHAQAHRRISAYMSRARADTPHVKQLRAADLPDKSASALSFPMPTLLARADDVIE